jgi:hypothetical protein
MLDRCKQLQILLKLKKCIFYALFGMLLGHVVCKEGLLLDQEEIATIVDMLNPTYVRDLCANLGHIGYYRKFIRSYAKVVALLVKIFCKDTKYVSTQECQETLDTLKERLVTTLILLFPY